VCVSCGNNLTAGTRAWWDADEKTVRCVACADVAGPTIAGSEDTAAASEQIGVDDANLGPGGSVPLDRGRPGRSLSEEQQRRRAKREQAVRAAHPRIGGFLLAVQREPQRETAFRQGRLGEERVGNFLDERTAQGPTLILHNRRMPAGRGDIDHIAISPNGVYVIDTKALEGKVTVRKPLFGSAKLIVDGRNKTKLLDGLEHQIAAVKAALAKAGYAGTSVKGVLCFTKADLPLLGARRVRGHELMYRKALARKLNRSGPVSASAIEQMSRALAQVLPAA
jgi:hypothetical protein